MVSEAIGDSWWVAFFAFGLETHAMAKELTKIITSQTLDRYRATRLCGDELGSHYTWTLKR
jgi:hypothetical protein